LFRRYGRVAQAIMKSRLFATARDFFTLPNFNLAATRR
jgi:hypothetical protein